MTPPTLTDHQATPDHPTPTVQETPAHQMPMDHPTRSQATEMTLPTHMAQETPAHQIPMDHPTRNLEVTQTHLIHMAHQAILVPLTPMVPVTTIPQTTTAHQAIPVPLTPMVPVTTIPQTTTAHPTLALQTLAPPESYWRRLAISSRTRACKRMVKLNRAQAGSDDY